MSKTMPRLRRAAATTAAVVLVASGAAVAGAPAAFAGNSAAFAGNCSPAPWLSVAGRPLCGAVNNKTGRTMHFTTTLGTGKTGKCDVWNWNGGPWNSFKHADCDQKPWGNGTVGGNYTGVDVDAFTFNSEGYHERFSNVGPWHWRKKGGWTKIVDGQVAHCRISNTIRCTVLWQ